MYENTWKLSRFEFWSFFDHRFWPSWRKVLTIVGLHFSLNNMCIIYLCHHEMNVTPLPSLPNRNGIYPLTAFGLPSRQQPQQSPVKSPIVTPSVKSPTPEPSELETRKVRERMGRVCISHQLLHNSNILFVEHLSEHLHFWPSAGCSDAV